MPGHDEQHGISAVFLRHPVENATKVFKRIECEMKGHLLLRIDAAAERFNGVPMFDAKLLEG